MTSGQGVIYLQRNGFYYKDDIKDAVVFHFSFLPSVVSDLDVLNVTLLTESIISFIGQNNLQTKDSILVISESVYFEKDYPGITREQEVPVTQLFIDSIPFENVLVKTYLIENGIKIVVANKDLCVAIKNAFEASGFMVTAVTPTAVLGIKETDPTDSSFSLFFEKYDFLKENAFPLFAQQVKKSPQPGIKSTGTQKKPSIRTILLIVFFLFLVVVLIVMLLARPSS